MISAASAAFERVGVAFEGTISLVEAASLAYEEVFSTRRAKKRQPTVDELDLVALALSARLPIYCAGSDRVLSKIPDMALMAGMFWGGGARFELGDGATVLTGLRVHKADLERVLEGLKGDAAGWSEDT
jgi:hypothetical protein